MKFIFWFIFLSICLPVVSQVTKKPAIRAIEKAAVITMKLTGSPDFLAADGDDVWVLNIDQVEKLSVHNSKPILSVPIPGACGAMIVGFNSLWVAGCKDQSVYRVNNKTGEILSKIRCGVSDAEGEISLAVGAGSVWILSHSSGVLTGINPNTNKVQAKITVLPNSFCAAYGYQSVWITNTNNHSVQRIDPINNKVVATIPVGKTPRFLAVGENGVWTLNQGDGTVTHIDPKTNKVKATVDTKVAGSGGDIDAGGGLIWIRSKDKFLMQAINSATDVVESVFTPVSGSGAVRATKNYVWVTAHDINTIWVLKH